MSDPRRFRKVLITGIGGSGGSFLAEYVAENHPDAELHGIARWHSTTQDNLRALVGAAAVHECDLMDFGSVLETVRRVAPDVIFHLASHANVRASFVTPSAVLANNVLGTSHLLEAVRILGLDPLVQVCSTSEVYGQVDPKDVPIREDAPMHPASPYAVSKAAQDLLGRTYWANWGMRVVTTRMFSYVNPRRSDLFSTSFARQVARIEAGLQDELLHGNLDSVRTLVDVRDAVRAYWRAAELGEPGEVYNIGGTSTLTVGDFLSRLVALARVPVRLRLDPALLRPTDVTLQVPCVERFRALTGWTPRYSIDESLRFLLETWRERTRREAPLAGGAR